MKKLILKTALITLGVTLILAISVFGIVSVSAPYAMMKLTASLGLDAISGDYAYQEFERSGDIDCLARSFLIAADAENNTSAEERFGKLCGQEGFEQYCAEKSAPSKQGVPDVSFRDYLYGKAACVKYRLAESGTERAAVISFALENTAREFPANNPAVALAAEAASKGDAAFCSDLLEAARGGTYTFDESPTFLGFAKILEEYSHE